MPVPAHWAWRVTGSPNAVFFFFLVLARREGGREGQRQGGLTDKEIRVSATKAMRAEAGATRVLLGGTGTARQCLLGTPAAKGRATETTGKLGSAVGGGGGRQDVGQSVGIMENPRRDRTRQGHDM